MLTTVMRSSSRSRGFSLIEIMIAMAIAAGIVIGIIVLVRSQSASIAEDRAKTEIRTWQSDIESFRMKEGRFPSTSEGLAATLPKGLSDTDKQKRLNDPWGHPYQYANPGDHGNDYDVWSMGPKNSPDSIIGSW